MAYTEQAVFMNRKRNVLCNRSIESRRKRRSRKCQLMDLWVLLRLKGERKRQTLSELVISLEMQLRLLYYQFPAASHRESNLRSCRRFYVSL